MCVCGPVATADGEEAERGPPAADTMWDHCGELAGKPHSEGVAESFLPGIAGYTLPGCWTGMPVGQNRL